MLLLEWSKSFRGLAWREFQHKSFIIGNQLKIFQIPGAGYHISIIVILKIIQQIYIHAGASAKAEQTCFVDHSMFRKMLDGLFHRNAMLFNWQIFIYQFFHPHFDPAERFLVYRHLFAAHIVALADRELHFHATNSFHAFHIIDCLQQKQSCTSSVCIIAIDLSGCQKSNRCSIFHFAEQLPHLVIFQNQYNIMVKFLLKILRQFQICRSILHIQSLSFYYDLSHIRYTPSCLYNCQKPVSHGP